MNKRKLKLMIAIQIMIVIFIAGCDDFWRQGDAIVHDVNNIAGGARAVLDSPAGVLIPPDLKLYAFLGIGLINAMVIGWEEWRNRTMKKTTKAIVLGIEKTDNPEKATSEVKANIADEMRNQGGGKFYARANKIVDKLKIS